MWGDGFNGLLPIGGGVADIFFMRTLMAGNLACGAAMISAVSSTDRVVCVQ